MRPNSLADVWASLRDWLTRAPEAVVTVVPAPVLCAAAGLVGALAYNLAARVTQGLAVEVT